MLLPTSLCLTAAAMLINFWLGMRCGKFRGSGGVSVGDGGNDMLMRRMRAQSNFIEQTPITLLAVALVELAGKGGMWLAPLGALFLLGRIAHGVGMDGNFKLFGAFIQQRQKMGVISRRREDGLAVVATLNHVVRITGEGQAG